MERSTEQSRRRRTTVMTVGLAGLVLGLSFWAGESLNDRTSDPAPRPTIDPDRGAKLATMGRLVYQVHCVRCHGLAGHGDGPDAATLKPPPRDFASSQWRFSPTIDSIHRVTSQGIPDSSMLAFGRVLSPTELDAVSGYVLGFAPTRLSALAPLIQASGMRPASPGAMAQTFEIAELDGSQKALDSYRGKLVLMTFWSPTCAPCLDKMPNLEQLAESYRGTGLEVLPVCVGESDSRVVANAVRGRLDRLIPRIDTSMGAVLFDVQATPTTVLIDRDGQLLGRTEGALDWTGAPLRALIDKALLP